MDLCQQWSLLFNMLSRFVTAFFPRSKCLLISWLQPPSTVILEPKKIKSVTVFIFSLLFAMKWWNWMRWPYCFEYWVLSQLFHSPLLPLSRSSLVPLQFLPLVQYHLHIWGCWHFSQQSGFQLVIHPAWHKQCVCVYIYICVCVCVCVCVYNIYDSFITHICIYHIYLYIW